MLVNEEFKKLVLSDENLLNELRVFFYMIYNKHNNENKEEYALNKDNYDFFCWYINEDEENKELKDYLTDVIKKIINDDLFNNFYNFFEELNVISAKDIIYSLSRLLYTQNKFKNNSIGQELDQIIKSYIDLLKTTPSNYTEQLQKIDFNNIPQEQLNEINKRLGINNLTHVIININYDIYKSKQDNKKIMSLWIENINKQDLKNFFDTYINNIKQDLETRDRQLDKISNIINSTIEQTQFNNFFEANINIINDLKNKTHNMDTNNHLKALISIKRKYIEKGEKDEKLDKILNDDFLNKMYDMYLKYQNTQEYKDLNLTNDDILIWREKADKFINHLETYKKDANINTFNLDYMLKHIAYNNYQKKVYKINLDDELKDVTDEVKTGLNREEIEEQQIPISKLRNHSLKHKDTQERDYVMMSSTKQANDLVNSITSYANYNENIYSIQKRIKELENKKKKSAIDKDQLNYLKDKLENRIKTKEELEQEEKTLLSNKEEISEKLKEIDNQEDIDNLNTINKYIDKRLDEINNQKNNKPLVIQQNLFSNNIDYNGKYITTSIDIDNFDLSKFTDEGITIFLYMIDQIITNPNIKDLTFDIDFIFNKMNNYKHNKKSIIRKEIENLSDILYNMNIKIIKEDKLNSLEIGRELRVITGRQWIKDKKNIKDANGLKSMTITFNDDFKTMILNSNTKITKLGDTKQVNQLQYYKIPLELIKFKNKKARNLGFYILQQDKLDRKNIKKGQPLVRTLKNLYNNDFLKLKYNKKEGQFKKDIVYKLEDYLNQLEDNRIILYNTDAFDKLRYDLSNRPIEEQKKIFDEEKIEIKVILTTISNETEATKK